MTLKRILTLFGLLLIIVTWADLHAQTITSKPSGGNWEDVQTWVGGVIPTSSHNVVIDGPVAVTSSSSTCKDLQIKSGKTLQNGGNLGWVTLHVTGNLTNHGTIQNNGSGNSFYVEVSGDLSNQGVMRQERTYLTTHRTQLITLASGAKFESDFLFSDASGYVDTNGIVRASSDLLFTRNVDLKWLKFDANNHTLHFHGGSIAYGLVKNTGSVRLSGGSSIGSITFQGASITLLGLFQIHDANVTLDGNVTNSDTLQNAGNLGWVTLHLKGNLVNNGLIRNNQSGNTLWTEIDGDVTNNGLWQHERTHLTGHRDQSIASATGKKFESLFLLSAANGYTDTSGIPVAASDLEFAKMVDLYWKSFDANGYTIAMNGGNFGYGKLINAHHLRMDAQTSVGNLHIVGDSLILHNTFQVHDANVRLEGNVINLDTLRNAGGLGWVTLHIIGPITNYGVVSNNPSGNALHVEVTGHIRNRGRWVAEQTHLAGSGRRIVELSGATTGVVGTGKKVIFTGNSVVPTLSNSGSGLMIVASEASLTVEDGTTNYGYSGVSNLGKIVIPHKTTANRGYYFYSGWLEFEAGRVPDSLIVESFGSQTPKAYGNALSRWWRINTVPGDERKLTRLELYYANDNLNGNAEHTLQLYRSSDKGITWSLVNDPDIYRDTLGNKIVLYDVQLPGDFVLASSADREPTQPNLIVTVSGSNEVRVGAPNPFLVNIYNKSDEPSGPIFLRLEANEKLHFIKIEDNNEGSSRTFNTDDLVYDQADQNIILLFGSLAPHEERDIMAYVTSTAPSSIIKRKDPQAFWFIAAAAVYVTGAVLEDYITDKMVDGCFDIWMPSGANDNDKSETKKEIGQTIKEGVQNVGVTTGKQLAEDASKKVLQNSILKRLIWPAKLGYQFLSCIENTIKGMQCYVGNKPIKDILTKNRCAGTQKQVVAVTSKDPNEKSGPSGVGSSQYMATASRMPYLIHFENAADAQAAAYKIVIRDTLSEKFDENSVVFGAMSHQSFTARREGRVLIWEAVGIDLPPNVVPPEGEGWVAFSVLPKQNLATGTELNNRASIVFDLNEPILTNSTTNILDFEPPTTLMLPPYSDGDSVATISWSSNDGQNGSGYKSSTVFMAEESGDYQIIGEQEGDSLRIILEKNKTYHFYVLAVDNVGNRERIKPTSVSVKISSSVNSHNSEDARISGIYPNPASSVLTVDLDLYKPSKYKIEVIDQLGAVKLVHSSEKLQFGKQLIDLNVASLPSGTYYIRLFFDGRIESRGFTITR